MTQAANTEHSDKITGLRWCVSQGAERREPRAQQRRRIDRGQVVRDRHEPASLGDHHFGVSAIMMNAGIFLVPAVHEIAVAAELAIAARPAEKPDTHALTDHPALDAGAKRIDPPDDLMAWDARPFDWKQSFHCAGIRVADPTRLDADPHLAGSRSMQCLFRQFQTAWADRLHCAIGRSDFHRSPLNRRAKCRGPEISSTCRHSTIAARDKVLAASDKMGMPNVYVRDSEEERERCIEWDRNGKT